MFNCLVQNTRERNIVKNNNNYVLLKLQRIPISSKSRSRRHTVINA